MWWQAVFWILLIPLVVVEIIVFLKTKRFAWLMYAIAIFTYVVAVSYTLDVFKAGRNAIILTLLASSVLMALIGRRLGRPVRKAKRVPREQLWLAIGLVAVLALLFIMNVVGGPASEQLVPVAGISANELIYRTEPTKVEPYGPRAITLATREVTNAFFLPLPVQRKTYRACVETTNGWSDLSWNSDWEEYPEVGANSQASYPLKFQPTWGDKDTRVVGKEVLIYAFAIESDQSRSYAPCDTLIDPIAKVSIS